MDAFTAVGSGWESRVSAGERDLIRALAMQALTVLGGAGPRSVSSPEDRQAIERVAQMREAMLPEAADDPLLAMEVGDVVRQDVTRTKQEHLRTVLAELRQPSGVDGRVRVRRGEEDVWLAAINDVRLSLAGLLEVSDSQAAEEVHRLAAAADPAGQSLEDERRHAWAIAYTGLTWWQESLLACVSSEPPDA